MSETAAATKLKLMLKLKNYNLNTVVVRSYNSSWLVVCWRGEDEVVNLIELQTYVVVDDQKTRSQLFGTKWKKIICNPPSGYKKHHRQMQTLGMDFASSDYTFWLYLTFDQNLFSVVMNCISVSKNGVSFIPNTHTKST